MRACQFWPILSILLVSMSFISTWSLADDDDKKVAPDNRVVFEDCSIGASGIQLPAQCATLDVLLDPSDASAGYQRLSIARIESRRRAGHSDALTLLAGGPGQSAIESFPAISFAFRHVMRDRDVILIDQRGTGESNSLNCPEDSAVANLDGGMTDAQDPSEIARLAQRCLESLSEDPRLFTTSIAVQDLESVRQQLGISQWNLYGISYGTRVAMHYLRRYPDAVRTLVLDAVVPPQVSLGPDIANLAQQSLEKIFARCELDEGCNEAFGNLTQASLAFIDELKARPRTITYEDVVTGQLTTRQFTHEQLAVTIRLMSYSSQTAAILPSMLYQAIENDNLAPFARQSDLQSASLNNSLSTGMHHAVICTEDVPFFETPTAAVKNDGAKNKSYLGDDTLAAIRATCNAWPAGVIDDDFKQPLESDKPTLILSGDADPITPPAYGNLVAKTLSNAKHIVNESQGHMQVAFGCMPVLLAQFIDSTDTQNLETDCLQRIRPLPFFIDANGPLP